MVMRNRHAPPFGLTAVRELEVAAENADGDSNSDDRTDGTKEPTEDKRSEHANHRSNRERLLQRDFRSGANRSKAERAGDEDRERGGGEGDNAILDEKIGGAADQFANENDGEEGDDEEQGIAGDFVHMFCDR